ncbi:unnamed protein product [Triticum turgidum subsp. durum]|uniref:SWI/SNF-like complex subunit BAF250 C-terminal domain-containing protein n=2 Tax=Triticinae TaxID=1648030 RepID=A0A9R1AZZ7_TRITD|nr:unnamed protein product [Triticum turgidum subsp. durum]
MVMRDGLKLANSLGFNRLEAESDSTQVINFCTDHNNKRIVLALQSGLKSEILWALNALTVLSFKEKDDLRRDTTPLAKVPGLLDALLQVVDDVKLVELLHHEAVRLGGGGGDDGDFLQIERRRPSDFDSAKDEACGSGAAAESQGDDRKMLAEAVQIDDWRDIAIPRDHTKPPRVRTLGVNTTISGFGLENVGKVYSDSTTYVIIDLINILSTHLVFMICATYLYSLKYGNFSPPNDQSKIEGSTITKKRSAGFLFDEDGLFNIDDEGRTERQQCAVAASNIIRNFSFMPENETIMVQHRHCLETIFQCLEDQNAAWHCAAAELIGRLIINPDNESFLVPVISQIYRRLVDLLSVPAFDAQAAAVSALYNVSEVNMDCRLKLASERWAVDRLLKIVKAPHPVSEVCRKAAVILESLVSEPQNRMHLLVHENNFAEILTSEGKYSDTFARILYELTARPSNKVTSGQAIWGNIN